MTTMTMHPTLLRTTRGRRTLTDRLAGQIRVELCELAGRMNEPDNPYAFGRASGRDVAEILGCSRGRGGLLYKGARPYTVPELETIAAALGVTVVFLLEIADAEGRYSRVADNPNR